MLWSRLLTIDHAVRAMLAVDDGNGQLKVSLQHKARGVFVPAPMRITRRYVERGKRCYHLLCKLMTGVVRPCSMMLGVCATLAVVASTKIFKIAVVHDITESGR